MALPERSAQVAVRNERRLTPIVAERAFAPPTTATLGRPLRRRSDHRVVSGVCAGLGQYLDIDPWVLRGTVLLLSLGQGSGVLFYLAAWLVIPPARDAAPSRRAVSRTGRALLLGAAALFALDLSVGLPISVTAVQALWPAFVIGLAIVILVRRTSRVEPRRRARQAVAAGLILFGLAWLVDAAGLAVMPWPVVLPASLAVGACAALLAAGDARWPDLARVALAVAVALGAVFLRAVPYQGGLGQRVVQPPRFGPLASQDEMAVGTLTLDLRHVRAADLPADITAGVGVGWLVVRLPADLAVEVDSRVASGEIQLGGRSQAGVGLQQEMVLSGPSRGPRLTLHLSAGFGAVIVPSPRP